MIKIDKKTLLEFQEAGIKKIHVFFYEAGCAGTKVDIETEFNEEDLELVAIFPELDSEGKPIDTLPLSEDGNNKNLKEYTGIKLYLKLEDKERCKGAMITKIRKKSDNPHLQGKKQRYIFSNPKVQNRCGCGTSFSFDKKVPKINLEKLRSLKERFRK